MLREQTQAHHKHHPNTTTYYGDRQQEMNFSEAGSSSAPFDAAAHAPRPATATFSSLPASSSNFPAFSWSTSPSAAPPFSSAPLPRRKRPRGRSQKGDGLASLSSPAHPFADAQSRYDGVDYGRDSDSCDSDSEQGEPLTPSYRYVDDGLGRAGSPEKAAHPKKRQRPHLDTEDVGRFAGMSIFEERGTGASHTAEAARRAGFGAPPSSPLSPVRAPPASPTTVGAMASGPLASSVALQASTGTSRLDEGREECEDVGMGRGPSSWEIDQYRSYIASLEDEADTSGSDAQGDQSDAQADGARYTAITQKEAEQLASFRRQQISKYKADVMSVAEEDDVSSHRSPSFAINPELLAKLEAHSRAVVLGGDISSRPIAGRKSGGVTPATTPPDQEEAKGELVLWRSPEEILAPSGTAALRAERSGRDSMAAMDSPRSLAIAGGSSARQTSSIGSSDLQEPLFAFGTHSPPKTFSPVFAAIAAGKARHTAPGEAIGGVGPADEVDQEMELDD
ncbi:hypothetical protein BCV69DRAFT_297810 [Microstroma glucosiphilum]|uniref:Uncharacterized protein n=1 Tax=Pseudomicrostroma glucosiphilum TaxID=1684307 RepID=A0A316UH66_9BASI|nr:hypothetical protein BCV69DRAFT_297810 [Pseudomicrostroma glucosiphilum]PWN22525.1 hypothetical protein BCV69DRAFT_297810 [Pseudomicrostroma glucosiphilum]